MLNTEVGTSWTCLEICLPDCPDLLNFVDEFDQITSCSKLYGGDEPYQGVAKRIDRRKSLDVVQ